MKMIELCAKWKCKNTVRISQFSSVAQLCLTLCDPMDCSMPGFPVHHQLPDLAQTHVHWVGDTIQPSHPLLSPSLPALNISQHQGLFKLDSSSDHVAKVLEFQLQHQSFQWIFRTYFLWDELFGSPCSPKDSQESSPTPQFKSINSSALSFHYSPLSHPYMTTGKTIALTRRTFVDKVMSLLFNMLSAAAAAAAKSLQSCPTLCNPIDGSPPGFPIPGILQARTLEWVAISFSNAWKWKVKVKLLSHVWLFSDPWTAAHQAPPSMGFSRQEDWSGSPLPSPNLSY